jgi:hypothetical protein
MDESSGHNNNVRSLFMSNLESNAATAPVKQKYNIIPAYLGADGQPTDAECAICGKTFEQLGDFAPALEGAEDQWVRALCAHTHMPNVADWADWVYARRRGVEAMRHIGKMVLTLLTASHLWDSAFPERSADTCLCCGMVTDGAYKLGADNVVICREDWERAVKTQREAASRRASGEYSF